jgi:PAS domain S-box-containing protein
VLDPERDGILEANPKAVQMLGYSHEEFLNAVNISSIHPDEMPQFLAFTQAVVSQGYGWTNELSCLTKSGQKLPVEISASVISFEGRNCILGLLRDITERKEAESATAQLAEIGELATMIVHEVRNPLTTILMGVESLGKLELPQRQQLKLALALDEGERLKRLLHEILDYARQETLNLVKLELNEFVIQMQRKFAGYPIAQGREIQVLSCLPEAWVQADPDKLKQVLINLLHNACEAIPKGERVTCSIHPGSSNQAVCLSIHNRGKLIPPEVLAKIGTPFVTTKASGNGLGLAIVKQIIKSHDGQFQIQSTAESGTIAEICLPLGS